jgi:hypothetical protein
VTFGSRIRRALILVFGPITNIAFRRRSVGCFSAVRAALVLTTSVSEWIRKERATRKNSQLTAARRVAVKMARRLRCLSVTYPFRYAPCRRPILTATKAMLVMGQGTGSIFDGALVEG